MDLPVVEPLSVILNWLVQSTATALPIILTAAIIILLGWITAKIIEKIVVKLLLELKIDKFEKQHRIDKALYGVRLTSLISNGIKWYIFLLFMNEAAAELGLGFIAGLLNKILESLPEWLFGGAMIGGALILGHRIQEKISESKLLFGKVGANAVYFVIIYFALVLSLPKFGFQNTEILVDTFKFLAAGISAGLAIAIGIAFGTALKEPAKKMLEDWIK